MIIAQTGLPASLNGQSVAAWKASRFPPNAKFPPSGAIIPASADVTGSVAAGAFSLTTPTDEDYWVATYVAGPNAITFHWFFRYTPPSYINRQDFSGPGAPPAAFKVPDGSTWTTTQSAAAGSRMWISWGGVWTATAA